MTMTHYMELLASHQPWNLITYMAIPVILAETLAIAELYLLFTRNTTTWVKCVSRWAGIIAGIYFFFIFINLFFTAVIPLTQSGGWRGAFDVIAVGFYLLGVVPLGGIALLELGFIKRHKSHEEKLKLHTIFVAIFLVVAHIAMIFGMLSPELMNTHTIPTTMNGMQM
jgi:hypothetical protein